MTMVPRMASTVAPRVATVSAPRMATVSAPRMAAVTAPRLPSSAIVRSLHASRPALAEEVSRSNTFVLDSYVIKEWSEIPKGGIHGSDRKKATWSKSMRATYDHQGLSESRVASHNSHFGFRTLNKKDFSIFPFKFYSMETIAQRHGVKYE